MRLVSWNVCDAFKRKFGHLERLRPDIAVLQEVRPSCLEFAALNKKSVWIGDPGRKGLAAVAYGDWRLEQEFHVGERWFLPVRASNGAQDLHIVAVWADVSLNCAPLTLRALAQLKAFMLARPCVIAGDFNQSVRLDRGKGPGRRFVDVLAELEALDMVSAWHAHRSEPQGEESEATLFWTWNESKKFHIDFAFGSKSLSVENVELGSYEQYVQGKISDHVPLVVDYAIPARDD